MNMTHKEEILSILNRIQHKKKQCKMDDDSVLLNCNINDDNEVTLQFSEIPEATASKNYCH